LTTEGTATQPQTSTGPVETNIHGLETINALDSLRGDVLDNMDFEELFVHNYTGHQNTSSDDLDLSMQ